MTHYMELLATNQPWNLIIFMAIPVILAETIAITELYLLYTRNFTGKIRRLSKIVGIILGIYFLGIFVYLMFNAFIPLTSSGDWRGFADIIAVTSYLLGVVPLFGIALLEMGFLYKSKSVEDKFKLHVIFVGIFLVVAHIAMIFGMINPDIYLKKNSSNIGEIHEMQMN